MSAPFFVIINKEEGWAVQQILRCTQDDNSEGRILSQTIVYHQTVLFNLNVVKNLRPCLCPHIHNSNNLKSISNMGKERIRVISIQLLHIQKFPYDI
ncbi:MAG: hypothetical protein ACJA2S_002399 [Cyclobacteriaceae bacterium]|jgi:hypothetical protein